VASDGRWYPPELHPDRTAAAAPSPPSAPPPSFEPAPMPGFLPPAITPPPAGYEPSGYQPTPGYAPSGFQPTPGYAPPGYAPPGFTPPPGSAPAYGSPMPGPAPARRSSTAKVVVILAVALVLLTGGCLAAIGVAARRANHSVEANVPAPAFTAAPLTIRPATGAAIVPAPDGAVVNGDTPCPAADGSAVRTTQFFKAPPMCIDPAKTYTAVITSSLGRFTVALDAKNAPKTANNFVVLARYHYFDESPCHRIIGGFMAQCGDPTGTGFGGDNHLPGYEFADENIPADKQYRAGQLAMANAGADTNGSQFFTLFQDWDASSVPGGYSVFGAVTDGMTTTVRALEAAADPNADNGVPPLVPVTILKVTITEA
jgi:cyclophilin family peptidyl-prolyl cis-trans isomerase